MEIMLKYLAWPVVALLFAGIFVFVFRKSLRELILHITSIDKSGVKTTTSNLEAQQEERKKEAVQELLSVIDSSVALQGIEKRIKAELEAKDLETKGDTITVLIKRSAALIMLLQFEQTHNVIFGSQIFLLKKLNEVAGQGKPREFVVSHFEGIKKLFPKELGTWDIEHYQSFLLNKLLITIDNNIYHITNLGVEYLIWIARNGREENKPF